MTVADPQDDEAWDVLADAASGLGSLLLQEGRAEEALAGFQRVLDMVLARVKVDPTNAWAQNDLAMCYLNMVKVHCALGRGETWREFTTLYVKLCERMMEDAPADPTAKADLAKAIDKCAWLLAGRDKATAAEAAEALAIAKRAEALSEERDPLILVTLALGYLRTGNLQEAGKIHEKAMGLLPGGAMDADMSQRLKKYQDALAAQRERK